MPDTASSSCSSGIHDALRQQTQDRLNAQLWEPHPELWNRLTERGRLPARRDNVDALLANQNQRVLAVVKKNGPRLRALKRWLHGARPELLAACPILIIDDEADQASVNTAKPDRSRRRSTGSSATSSTDRPRPPTSATRRRRSRTS